MKIYLGDDGLKNSKQADFLPAVGCSHCGNEARIAFVVEEEYDGSLLKDKQDFVCDLYKNGEDDKFWPHDCVAVAIYFCGKCSEVTANYNQA